MNLKRFFSSRTFFFEVIFTALSHFRPQHQLKNPVIFCIYIGAIFNTIFFIFEKKHSVFDAAITLLLWSMVFLSNLADALADLTGEAITSLKSTKTPELVSILKENEKEFKIPSSDLKQGDIVVVSSGELIPADGEVVNGIAIVDESVITGESAPVIRESSSERSIVTAKTRVLKGKIFIRISSEPGSSFIDEKTAISEYRKRKKTPNELSLFICILSLSLIFIFNCALLKSVSNYFPGNIITVPVLIAVFSCLSPTTIGALFNSIGIASIHRLADSHVITKSKRSLEAAGDIDLLILARSGTITLGNRIATEFYPAPGVDEKEFAEKAQLASSDATAEGRSLISLAKVKYSVRRENHDPRKIRFFPFTKESRMSGADICDDDGKVVMSLKIGAPNSIKNHIEHLHGTFPEPVQSLIEKVSKEGGTPLVVSEGAKVLGMILFKDLLKGGIKERFEKMRKLGIKTIMMTGDNPLTAAAIAAEAGLDDFVAELTPEKKMHFIKEQQKKGYLVAMIGDAINEAPALAQADIGVAMNTRTQASREAGNMIDLDSNPTKLIDIVEIGKQTIMTRGVLTIFNLTNYPGKYLALIPALFAGSSYDSSPLSYLNILHLSSAKSAILSTLTFNVLCIALLIPLALKGVRYRAHATKTVVYNNFIFSFVGGLFSPLIGIKIIDMLIGLY